jgi:hypothetical protein
LGKKYPKLVLCVRERKMGNPNPKLENLDKGRGRKPKLGHQPFTINLPLSEKQNLDKIAQSLNCKHGQKGSLSRLLSQIANEELMILKTPPDWKNSPEKESKFYIDDFDETVDQDIEDSIGDSIVIKELPNDLNSRKR